MQVVHNDKTGQTNVEISRENINIKVPKIGVVIFLAHACHLGASQ